MRSRLGFSLIFDDFESRFESAADAFNILAAIGCPFFPLGFDLSSPCHFLAAVGNESGEYLKSLFFMCCVSCWAPSAADASRDTLIPSCVLKVLPEQCGL